MKCSTLIAAIPLLQLAAAQPHRRRHVHEHQLVKKDDDIVVTVIHTVYAQASAFPQVIVYVDENGKAFSTAVDTADEGYVAVQTPSPIPAAPIPAAPAPVDNLYPVASIVTPLPSVSTYAAIEPVKAPDALPSTPAQSSGVPTGFGIVYSPYRGDGTCKTLPEIQKDFTEIPPEYSLIRIYGVDCDQVANVLSVVRSRKIKLFAGIFDIEPEKLKGQVDIIINAVDGAWNFIETISVGNELVNNGAKSPAEVITAVRTVRALLNSAGYFGNVVAVDTLVASRANPSLCDSCDYCAVNCHPFFDGKVAAANAGKFLIEQIDTLREKLANKNQRIVLTETGWPWNGNTNGLAVPSLKDQAEALSSIRSAFDSKRDSIILFMAFNDASKKNNAFQFGTEKYWGINGTDAPSERPSY